MSDTWHSEQTPPEPRLGPGHWVRFAFRALLLVIFILPGLALILVIRLFEKPLCGLRRPVSGRVQQLFGRYALWVARIPLRVTGRPMTGPGAFVANHSTWLDIFSLAAPVRLIFVAKSEVAAWPGVGPLARICGTIFIRRHRREARVQQGVLTARFKAGQRLLFFPEGTSTDGRRVLAFKSTLFASFLTQDLRDLLHIQPVTVIYRAPAGQDRLFYGWWGDMSFAGNLVKVFGARRQGSVEVIYHDPLKVADFNDRKSLALACEQAVRGGMPWDWQRSD
ncbi:lysophospholipid acyltransferase family protein [Pseudooceanicola algae]|uniref:Phospholipid/glycerol acyltransferase domain-containing protein n=1 Tax=Pseudooceanicola algae TaxID=1537215 RepID=A0A418SE38_9RHOB|nr:lysophospholipid acyltransferase family protein [Pseudooceanicola algae]QPM89616.1 hypothetical protein PSAL_008380 [Pseudooceanicola algae]